MIPVLEVVTGLVSILFVFLISWLTYYYWQNRDYQCEDPANDKQDEGKDEDQDEIQDDDTLIDQFFGVTIDEFQNQRHTDHPEPESITSHPEPEFKGDSRSAPLFSGPNVQADSGGVSMTDEFQNQRHGDHAKYQFAILFMSKRKKLIHLSRSMKYKNNHPSKKLTDSECKIFPPDENVVNYLTSRPNKLESGVTEHAESLLLGKLDLLMEKFDESNCETIVLYTWLLPCNDCKTEIIENFNTKKKHVILAYTSKRKNEENEDGIVKELKSAGIEVRKVKYPHKLQPLKPKQN